MQAVSSCKPTVYKKARRLAMDEAKSKQAKNEARYACFANSAFVVEISLERRGTNLAIMRLVERAAARQRAEGCES